MWLILPQGFLSIVHKPPCRPDELLVRARVRQHLATVFPGAKITESDGTDYRFRAVISRDDVAAVMAQQAYAIDYGNFKNEVKEHRFHDALMDVWNVLEKLQPFGAYGRRRRAAQQPLPLPAPAPWRGARHSLLDDRLDDDLRFERQFAAHSTQRRLKGGLE